MISRPKSLNLTLLPIILCVQIEQALQTEVVQKQLELLRFRSTCKAFTEDADIQVQADNQKLMIRWSNPVTAAQLDVDFATGNYRISQLSYTPILVVIFYSVQACPTSQWA